MASLTVPKVAWVCLGAVLLAIAVPFLSQWTAPLLSFVTDFPFPDFPLPVPFRTVEVDDDDDVGSSFVCEPHPYRTQLISLDPLVIYIHSFMTQPEIDALLEAAEPNFAPSLIVPIGQQASGHKQQTSDRTSESAAVPRSEPALDCVQDRALDFMGTLMRDDWDDMGSPQLVRYTAGQRFNLHHDWYDTPRIAVDGSARTWNRVASFFAILQDNCTEGETYFPYIKGIAGPNPWAVDGEEDQKNERPAWRKHEDGGIAFRPIAGNAVFWVNLFPNGTGDERVMHAGLPLGSGLKTAMNIWPRQYYRA